MKGQAAASLMSTELQQTALSPLTPRLEALWDAFWRMHPCVLFRFDVLYVQTGGLGSWSDLNNGYSC